MLLLSMAIVRSHKVWGHQLDSTAGVEAKPAESETDGRQVINTTTLGQDITGYGGIVPLEITIKDGVVEDVKALDNQESPAFFEKAATLLGKWRGKRVDEALGMQVDAVSGATYSSRAIIGNMQRGLQLAAKSEATAKKRGEDLPLKTAAALAVALMAAVLPLVVKNRRYQLVQMVLNVAVLGFWCGQFLSYTSIVGFMAGGFVGWASAVMAVMLVTAFVYPLLGRKSYYCSHVCPMGSMQQLAGMCGRRKMRLSASTLRRLDIFRQMLWAMLMLLVWSDVWAVWMDNELFTAFVVQSAAWPVMVVAVLFVLLSVFVPRPFCRFVCPMGTLFRLSQTSK